MPLSLIQTKLTASPALASIRAVAGKQESVYLRGCPGPFLHLLLAHHPFENPLLCVFPSTAQALSAVADFQMLGCDPHYLPPGNRKPLDPEHMRDPVTESAFLESIREINRHAITVSTVSALMEKVPTRDYLVSQDIIIHQNEEIALESLTESLYLFDFNRVEYVSVPGEFAMRGGIIDIYPYSADQPLRIELFGEQVDSIRSFDPTTQLSVAHLTSARIAPTINTNLHENLTSLTKYFSDDTTLVLHQPGELQQICMDTFEDAQNYGGADNAALHYVTPTEWSQEVSNRTTIAVGSGGVGRPLALDVEPHPVFGGHVKLLRADLHRRAAEGYLQVVACDAKTQTNRLSDLLEKEVDELGVQIVTAPFSGGFVYPQEKIALYTDHEIFDRSHRPRIGKRRKSRAGISLRALKELQPGDFVVHIDYGVGVFVGMKKISVRDRKQEAVELRYRGSDTLYVSVSALHKIHKYKGKEGHQPALTKLGSGQWERSKSRTKKRVKDIARDLIKLYAERRASNGFAFSADSVWQKELEASFEFEDTPDQRAAIDAIKTDMETPVPMDRLLCGDVGFGKTEVALRAAFKAVQDGKQVAILVPTTILAAQHLETFQKRLDRFPVKVDMLSRFRSKDQQKITLEETRTGKVDILIGTHRMASKDIAFRDLGLLIVDEEQRFGVAVKERLRKLRAEVDTLTMTATPIPRTLQFSLMGSRDLSIISTPPPSRQSIETEIHSYDTDLVRDAIMYEIARGGQVFFIHNRVASIEEMASTIRELVPSVRIKVAHGQMRSNQLEKVMMDFKDGKFDVLVSTNIIENGLDIANANTIIINRAHMFGLAELHQLRGRVGRADQKAFCYLLVPSIHKLTREARQRLNAVEEFSELGSGFHLAMRDMDIRGAGSLLGAEQSGHITDLGFDVYHKILDEAVQELKMQEFSELLTDERIPSPTETAVDINEDALIPETYVTNRVERLNLYTRINDADSDEIDLIRREIIDRFGAMPQEVEHLFAAMRLKRLGQVLRVKKVAHKNGRIFLSLPDASADPHFYEGHFHRLLEALNTTGKEYVMKESPKSKTVRVVIQDTPTLGEVIELVGNLAEGL